MDTLIFCGLNINAWITIAVILTMFVLMSATKIPADIVFVGGMATLYISGVLSMQEAMEGFSSSSVVTIGVLFVVIAGLVHTGVVQWIVKYLMGTPASYPKAIVRLMLPVAFLSSFLTNTTIVVLFTKVVDTWAKKLKIAPSKLLIPLSYASGMGGVCTLIGTPPNLIISSFYMSDTNTELNIFTPTIPGLFCLFIGILSVIALRKLLPVRKSPNEAFSDTAEYTVELTVPSDCPYIGCTIEEANLLNIKHGRLIEIIRFDKEIISPVPAQEFIMGNDHLVFSGEIDEILELKKTHHLVSAQKTIFSFKDIEKGRKLMTAAVDFISPLVGKTIIETNFESANNLLLVAVARKGERINESPRDIRLKAGDTLLFECPKLNNSIDSIAKKYNLQFFDSEDIPKINKKTIVSTIIIVGMILLSSFNVVSLLQSCFLAAFAMLITRCCSIEQAQKSVNWNILMIFAGSICLGTAIETTGLATFLANDILNVCGTNPVVVLTCICLVGTFLTELISNTAAAAIFYPIAYQSAVSLAVNPLTFCVALMISISSSFATPIGSPTHMLVYSAGGYRFTDFLKIGILMNFIILAANIFIVLLLFPL